MAIHATQVFALFILQVSMLVNGLIDETHKCCLIIILHFCVPKIVLFSEQPAIFIVFCMLL